ncbi:MAG: phage tail protein [Firmicutes bacterium HGW-Firmicutes-16]|nr:MAG: phage tail protein [Firmicutes bacterium HGW-Firmicutes-16]
MTAINNLPNVSFIDDKTIEDVKSELVSDYEAGYKDATGTEISLAAASPMRLALYAAAAQIYQALQYVDREGKQSLLKYSYGAYLENLAALKGLTRAPTTAATTTLRFSLSEARASAVAIPSGTRATGAAGVYFSTSAYAEIAIGATYVDVAAICTTVGAIGNGLAAGTLATIVDPIAYVASVANTTESEGGADTESDADLAYRAFLAPSSYSTAGPAGAYEYWVKNYNSNIGDVVVANGATDGTVCIVFIMDDGSLPSAEVISGVQAFLDTGAIRPLTDKVTVAAPTEVPYTINLTYYISKSDSAQAVAIQAGVAAAVSSYITWQRKLGRSINPSKLTAFVMAAGAKRVTVTAPTYATISETAVAALSGSATSYGGLEDD